jgi:hypothetical protein
MGMFRKRPFRCRSCRRRFYSYVILPDEVESGDVDEGGEAEGPRPA